MGNPDDKRKKTPQLTPPRKTPVWRNAQLFSRIILLAIALLILASVAAAQLTDSSRYRIRAVSAALTDTVDVAYLKLPKFPQVSQLVIPLSFTPNGDGIQDKFCLRTVNVRDLRCRIYSATGGQVAELLGPSDCWDGSNALVGYYLVRVDWVNAMGEKQETFGKTLLVR